MARVKGIMQITGSMKGVSMYTVRGSDEVIIRTKGGPSKHTIKTSESCKALRENGKEWGGCTKAASYIRLALGDSIRLADYNLSGALNAICKKIQCNDTEGEKGTRSVLLSQNRKYLTDFNFNQKTPLNQVIRINPTWEINREQVKATINIPDFNPDIHLTQPNKLPLMRWVVVLGVASDYKVEGTTYFPMNETLKGYRKELCTPWNPVKRMQEAQTLEVMIDDIASYLTENDTLILTFGVEFGTIGINGEGEAVKWAGCAKVVGSL